MGCLNNDSSTDPASVLGGHGVLRSDEDVDEQLLLVIPFKSKVKLYSVNFSSEDASDNASGPLNVKLFKDRPDMDFAGRLAAGSLNTARHSTTHFCQAAVKAPAFPFIHTCVRSRSILALQTPRRRRPPPSSP